MAREFFFFNVKKSLVLFFTIDPRYVLGDHSIRSPWQIDCCIMIIWCAIPLPLACEVHVFSK